MKKKILTTILFAVVICLSFSIFNQVNATENSNGLSTLITSATGNEVKLDKDYTIDGTVTISKSITLDLNGHTIKTGSDFSTDHKAMLEVNTADVKVTIKDSSASQKGKILFSDGNKSNNVVDVCAVFVKQGSVTITGGTFTSTDANNKWGVIEIGHGSNDNAVAGYLTMTGGKINSQRFGIVLEKGELTVSGSAVIKSQSATVMTRSNDGNNPGFDQTKINIKGGTIESEGNNAIQNRSKGNVAISGGNITGATAVYSAGGNLNITGGTLTANGNDVINGYEDGVKEGAAVIVNNEKNNDTHATINGATINSSSEPVVYVYNNNKADATDVLDVQNAVSNKEIDSKYVSSDLKVKITSNGKATYYTGEQDDENIKDAFNNLTSGTITVLQGDLTLKDVKAGITIQNSGNGNVTVNGTKVTEEDFVVPEPETPTEKDDTPKTGVIDVALVASMISAITLAGVVAVKKYSK